MLVGAINCSSVGFVYVLLSCYHRDKNHIMVTHVLFFDTLSKLTFHDLSKKLKEARIAARDLLSWTI